MCLLHTFTKVSEIPYALASRTEHAKQICIRPCLTLCNVFSICPVKGSLFQFTFCQKRKLMIALEALGSKFMPFQRRVVFRPCDLIGGGIKATFKLRKSRESKIQIDPPHPRQQLFLRAYIFDMHHQYAQDFQLRVTVGYG